MGCSPWGQEELDTIERLHFHFSLSCIGEGNGNPLQNSCLENPRDGGAWWAAISGVTQSRTRLKRLSSSSSSSSRCFCPSKEPGLPDLVPVSLPSRSRKERGVRWGGGIPQAGVGTGTEPGQRGTGEQCSVSLRSSSGDPGSQSFPGDLEEIVIT